MACGEELGQLKMLRAESGERELRLALRAIGSWSGLALLLAAFMSVPLPPALGQDSTPQQEAQVEGTVRDSAGKPMAGASVLLQRQDQSKTAETRTDSGGAFVFLAVRAGAYTVKIEKSRSHDAIESSINLVPGEKKHCDLMLRGAGESSASSDFSSSSPNASSAIELDDRPNFIVAGITDSTGSGGHGSETRMRTGEVLAKETLNLEADESKGATTAAGPGGHEPHPSESVLRAALLQDPQGFEANHNLGEFYLHSKRYREAIPLLRTASQVNPTDHANARDLVLAIEGCEELIQARDQLNQMLASKKELGKEDEADLRRLLGDLDEKADDPLGAVREYERAAGLDASEQNYFAWGAELLLHRAVAPALEVFGRGVRLHPDSARMLAGLGAALYTSGSVEEAAQRLCAASDLSSSNLSSSNSPSDSPSDSAPYLFLGEMQEATSTPLPCIEQRLARFAHDQPGNAFANYYYALALWKRDRGAENPDALRRVETLLLKSSAIDPKLDLAYLQLGNLYFARGSFHEAVTAYQKAVVANPAGSEVHYRLGLTYKRIGEEAKAQREFEEYKQLDKKEAAGIERQRRELRQFIFVLKDQALKDQPISHAISDPLPTSVSK